MSEEPRAQDRDNERRLEAQLTARGDWRELAQLFRQRADRSSTIQDKLDALTELAELLEKKLSEPRAAAAAFAEIVQLSGDPRAVAEQNRLLKASDELVRRGARAAAAHDAPKAHGHEVSPAGARGAALGNEVTPVGARGAADVSPVGAGRAALGSDVSPASGRGAADVSPVGAGRAADVSAAGGRGAAPGAVLSSQGARSAALGSDVPTAASRGAPASAASLGAAVGPEAPSSPLADNAARAQAHLARAEALVQSKQPQGSRADFEAALALVPDLLPALAGLAEVAALTENDPGPYARFKQALASLPRKAPGRQEWFRRLARVADGFAREAESSRWAWGEVLSLSPQDEEARERLERLARQLGDDVQLEQVLRAQLKADPRGVRSRRARVELVTLLESAGRKEEALAELRQATRLEPDQPAAWLALAERLLVRAQPAEAASALEQAALATANEAERARLWRRLAALCRDTLQDAARAQDCEARAAEVDASMARAQLQSQSAHLAPTEVVTVSAELAAALESAAWSVSATAPRSEAAPVEKRPHSESDAREKLSRSSRPESVSRPEFGTLEKGGRTELAPRAPRLESAAPEKGAHRRPTVIVEHFSSSTTKSGLEASPFDSSDDPLEIATGDFEAVLSKQVLVPESVRRALTVETERVDPEPGRRKPELRIALIRRIHEKPLEADAYLALSDYFDDISDPGRSTLMAEIGDALDGDPNSAPLAPKFMLSETDRAGLRHPSMRTEAGELLSLTGAALVKLYPAQKPSVGSPVPFRLDSGKGAQAVANALLASVRILGIRSPDIYLSEDSGPPFTLVNVKEERLLIGKGAVRKPPPEPELRFFAGRALFAQNPDLLFLRSLRADQLARAFEVLGEALGTSKRVGAQAKLVRAGISPKAMPRARELYARVGRSANLTLLAEAARHSVNRAGLVVCGGIAPALAALKDKRASEAERVELIRFAASERYLDFRNRRS